MCPVVLYNCGFELTYSPRCVGVAFQNTGSPGQESLNMRVSYRPPTPEWVIGYGWGSEENGLGISSFFTDIPQCSSMYLSTAFAVGKCKVTLVCEGVSNSLLCYPIALSLFARPTAQPLYFRFCLHSTQKSGVCQSETSAEC